MTNFEHVRTIIKCTYKSAHYESKQLEFTPKNKDFMHFKASPVISKLCSKMFNKSKCSMVSKAASKSNSTNKDCCLCLALCHLKSSIVQFQYYTTINSQ